MAKTIKFNLQIDGNYVNSIDGLRENFCINDVLDLYKNGLLEKWLKVRGFDEYLSKIEKIDKNSDNTIVELIKIFDMEKDDNAIGDAIYSFTFDKKRIEDLEKFEKSDMKLREIIDKYHKDYLDLKTEIVANKENMAFLKSASNEISKNYLQLFQLDYIDSFFYFNENAPLFIYANLMNEKLKYLWLTNASISKVLEQSYILNSIDKVDNFIYGFEIFKKKEA